MYGKTSFFSKISIKYKATKLPWNCIEKVKKSNLPCGKLEVLFGDLGYSQ